MANSAYTKGVKHERCVRKILEKFGEVIRAPMSGAYTGAVDLVWWWQNRKWGVSCKIRKDGFAPLYNELEKDDTHMVVVRQDRKRAIVALYLDDLHELIGGVDNIN